MTISQLRAATAAQIAAAMSARLSQLSKRQLIRLELAALGIDLDAVLHLADSVVNTYHPDRQIASRVEVRRDVLGAKAGSRRVDWTYYPTGEVDTITVQELDAADQLTAQQVVKPYTDGRQPEVQE